MNEFARHIPENRFGFKYATNYSGLVKQGGLINSTYRGHLTSTGIPIVKMRWSNGNLIHVLITGIPVLGERALSLKQAPRYQHIKAETKWLPLCRQNFQIHFLE